MQYDTTLTRTELERTVAAMAPEWRLRDADAAPSAAGQHIVYRLAVETPNGVRDCYLKGTPEGADSSIDLEARILGLLDARTSLPVPSVYGLVDDREGLPSPFALLEALPGEVTSRTSLSSLPRARHLRIARETGRRLVELHALDAVEAYGFLATAGPPIDGERPSGDPDEITVVDPVADWPARLRDWAGETTAGLQASRFDDLEPAAERAMAARIDGLDGPFDPVLARIDHSVENVLVTEGRLTGLIDWEFSLAATPAYDVVHVAHSLAGGPFSFAPAAPDRRNALFEAVLDGYRDAGGERVADQARRNRACYELLCRLRAMAHLDDWFAMLGLGEQVDGAAAALRTEVNL